MNAVTGLPVVERFTRFTDEHRQNACCEIPVRILQQAIQLAANELPRYYKVNSPENHPALKLLSSWWNQNAFTAQHRQADCCQVWVRVEDNAVYRSGVDTTPDQPIDSIGDQTRCSRWDDFVLLEFGQQGEQNEAQAGLTALAQFPDKFPVAWKKLCEEVKRDRQWLSQHYFVLAVFDGEHGCEGRIQANDPDLNRVIPEFLEKHPSVRVLDHIELTREQFNTKQQVFRFLDGGVLDRDWEFLTKGMTVDKLKLYWAIAIDVNLGNGRWRLDTGFIETDGSVGLFEDCWKKVEAMLSPSERLLDYVSISKKIFDAKPQCFVSGNGWVGLNSEVFRDEEKQRPADVPEAFIPPEYRDIPF